MCKQLYEGAGHDTRGPGSMRRGFRCHDPKGPFCYLSKERQRGILSESHVLGSLPKLGLCINGRSSPWHFCHSNAEHPNFS